VDDFILLGEVPSDWCAKRVMGTASAEGDYAQICSGEWITYLRRKLASESLRLGITDLDASVLQSGSPRHITQLASRVVYELGFAGIYYRSRYSHELENWALYEPFRIRDTISKPITKDNPALHQALNTLGLKLA
jgi:hypothetical protein